MRRTLLYAGRVTRELLRDPLSTVFGIGFPVMLLVLLYAIQRNIPTEAEMELFRLELLTPGVAVFGLSFLGLFAAQTLSRDRSGAFLERMLTTPMRASDFILGYTLPLLPIALVQGLACYLVAYLLGLAPSVRMLPALLSLLPVSGVYIGLGLMAGALLSEKAATSLCGALLTNASALLSGTWFSLEMVGDGFLRFAECLPFAHAVELGRAVWNGGEVMGHLLWVSGYAVILLLFAVLAFRHRMTRGAW